MSPSPRGNMSDQDNMSYNFSQMPNHSPNEAEPNATSGLEYVQQSPVNVCQNNEIAEYGTDTVADSEFMDSNDNANTMEHQECTYDNSPESHPGTIMPHENRDYNKKLNSSPRQFVGSDFRKEYIKIRDRDTRKRYKVEFGRNYDRYRELHCKIEQVSKRFATLESELRREPEGSESFKVCDRISYLLELKGLKTSYKRGLNLYFCVCFSADGGESSKRISSDKRQKRIHCNAARI